MHNKSLKRKILFSFKSPSGEAKFFYYYYCQPSPICIYESLKTLQVLKLHFVVEHKIGYIVLKFIKTYRK